MTVGADRRGFELVEYRNMVRLTYDDPDQRRGMTALDLAYVLNLLFYTSVLAAIAYHTAMHPLISGALGIALGAGFAQSHRNVGGWGR